MLFVPNISGLTSVYGIACIQPRAGFDATAPCAPFIPCSCTQMISRKSTRYIILLIRIENDLNAKAGNVELILSKKLIVVFNYYYLDDISL